MRSFLDSAHNRNGSSVRELQNADTDNKFVGVFDPNVYQGGRIPMSTDAAEFTSHRFLDARSFRSGCASRLWREDFGRCIVHVDMEPLSNVPFQAEATLQASGVCAARMEGFTPCVSSVQKRTSLMVMTHRRHPLLSRRSQLSQRGQEIELHAGDAIAILHSEPAIVTYAKDC